MIIKHFFKIILFSFFFMILNGCVNPPREVRASLPLVEKKSTLPVQGAEVPLYYWQYLSSPNQTSVSNSQFHFSLSPIYTSALGVLCRKITLNDTGMSSQSRIVCTNTSREYLTELSAWYLVPDIKGADKSFPL